MALQGNVLNFGADDSGTTDSSAAIQSAMDSDFAVFFPPGTYRLDTGITISKPKLIECFGGAMATGYVELGDSVSDNPAATYEQVRFVWNGSSSGKMITYAISKIFWHGGCFDVQGVSGFDGSIFYLPCIWESQVGGRQDGYGCGVQGVVLMGNGNELRANTAAPTGIEIDLLDPIPKRNFSFIYHGIFDVTALGMHHAIYHTARHGSWNFTSNSHEYQVRCRDTKIAFRDEGGNDSWLRIWHLASPIFNSQALADTTASLKITTSANRVDLTMFRDFDQGGSGSEWHNSKTFNITGAGSIIRPTQDSIDRAINISEQKVQNEYNLQKFGPTGGTALLNVTESQLQSSGSAVNQGSGKRDGMLVYVSDHLTNTENVPIVVATGPNPGDTWRSIASGVTVYDP